MTRIIAVLLAVAPLAAFAQDATQQPAPAAQAAAEPAPPQQAAAPAAQPAPAAYPAQPYPAAQPAYPPQGAYPQQPAYPPQGAYPPPAYPQGAYPPAVYPRPQQRGSWYIGFGVGGGDGGVDFGNGQSYSFDELLFKSPTTVSLNFKAGATLSPKALVGFDITAVRAQASEGSVTEGAQVTNYDAVFTWFPMEKGLFLRGGAGLSVLIHDWDDGYASGSESWTGVNVLGGVGYAFWLGQSFNLTANLDFSAQSYGGDTAPDSSHIWQVYVGFDWY